MIPVNEYELHLTPAWKPLRYHVLQSRLWTSSRRFVYVAAGRGSGKTELSKRRLVRCLPIKKEWSDPRYFFGAPTLPQAKRIAWHSLLKLVPRPWIYKVSSSDNIITTVFGSELHVVSFDRPQRIEGNQWDGGVIDESCDIKPGTFNLSVLPALTWRMGWCWRIGVPKRYGIGAVEFRGMCEAAQAGQMEDAEFFGWPSSDILPKDALIYARQHMDPKDYDEQFNARFITAAGGIFSAFDRQYNVRPCAYRSTQPILIGSDFNVDPMCWVIGHRYGDRIEIFDELWIRDATTKMALDVIYFRYRDHKGGFEFYGDATGKARKTSAANSDLKQIIEDARFKALGRTILYLRSNPTQADRFAASNALICNGAGERKLHIDPRCKRLIHDIENRVWKSGARVAEDRKDQGHMSDALGYIIYKLFPIRIPIEGRILEVTIRR